MTKAKAILFGILSALWVGGVGYAQYHAPAVVAVPAYAAAYAPEQAQARFDGLDKRLASIEAKLDQLLKLAADDEPGDSKPADPGAPPKPPAAGTPADTLRSAATVCAGCHHADVFEAKGGGFQLFGDDGTFRKLTARDAKKVVDLVGSGQMPPPASGKTLTPAQSKALADWFKAAGGSLPKP